MRRLSATDMKNNFLKLYDKVTNFAAPGYEADEISLFLTKAQDQLVKRYYNHKGNKYQEGFEETEKRRKDLAELIEHVNIDTSNFPTGSQAGGPSEASANGILVNLPEDLLYTLREEVKVSADDPCLIPNSIIPVKAITHDEYTANIYNPWKKPSPDKVWRVDYSSDTANVRRHELITDGNFKIDQYRLRYLRQPKDIVVGDPFDPQIIDIDCELNASVHDEIVDIAVRIATGITDPGGYNIKLQEEATSE
jgi:hypothetical protein